METSAFLTIEFWALVIVSFVVPCMIFITVIRKRRLKRAHVLFIGLVLVILAGTDVILLRQLEILARETSNLMDDTLFLSEHSLALYVLPLVSGALGTDLLSHIITSRLVIAEHETEK